MDVSIVIRTKDEAEYIGETLKRVEEQEFSGNYEIIVVDSGSTDATLDIISGYDVRFIQIPQREFSYGRSLNIGAGSAKGRLIVNLSAHALPTGEQWLTNLIKGFENHDVAGVYGRQVSIGEINPFDAWQNEIFFGPQKIIFNMKNMDTLKQIHFSNSNCAIRKSVWEEFRFNEDVPYAEDTLWQTEVINSGFSIIYVPDAAVYHTHKINIYDTYKCSKGCAYTLALMKQKRTSIAMVICDTAIFLSGISNSLIKNIEYMWRGNYLAHLKIVPLYVVSGWLGWLVGRIEYRLDK
jgi:rhamnosyltransferase